MIYLKVREWHQRAIALYTNIGFKVVGRFTEIICDQSVRFIRMEFINPDLAR
jgi:RimJ/RimL family protein N-acetyltransferase